MADVLPADARHATVECEHVFNAFHCHIDNGHATRALELFHGDDPVFEVRGERHAGHDALARFLRAREANTARHTRHLASNFRLHLESERAAHATANLTLYTKGADDDELRLEAVIDCTATFVRLPGGEWRMTTRRHRRFASAP